jgi:hypothetical protein
MIPQEPQDFSPTETMKTPPVTMQKKIVVPQIPLRPQGLTSSPHAPMLYVYVSLIRCLRHVLLLRDAGVWVGTDRDFFRPTRRKRVGLIFHPLCESRAGWARLC